MKKDQRSAILITGASGGLASILVDQLLQEYQDQHQLVGVDPRAMPEGRSFPGQFYQVDYTHRKMAEIFRQHHFHTLLHLGRIRSSANASASFRFKMNVLGTKNLLELAQKHGVKNWIVCSSFHVYGAHQYNHVYIREDEPLRASQTFPELIDAIELDHTAATFLWQYREVRTVILRPVNVIGPRIRNTISTFLRSDFCPKLLGYDPLLQFVHEQDLAQGFLKVMKSDRSGVFNIAGEGAVAYSKAIELAGAVPVPVPSFVAYPLVGVLSRAGLAFPKHLIDYFKYPTVVSDESFKSTFDYQPQVKTRDALKSLRK